MSSASSTLILGALVALSGFGCATFHSTRNAPGKADIREPPPNLRSQTVVPPVDPGEHMLIWNAGVLGGGGVSMANTDVGWKSQASGSAGGETSVHLGWSPTTHAEDSWVVMPFPGTTLGLNLGWTVGTSGRISTNAGYVEAQVSRNLLYSLAAGWAFDVARGTGPQVTAALGPVYLRSTTLLGAGTAVEIGLVLKVPIVIFAWSR